MWGLLFANFLGIFDSLLSNVTRAWSNADVTQCVGCSPACTTLELQSAEIEPTASVEKSCDLNGRPDERCWLVSSEILVEIDSTSWRRKVIWLTKHGRKPEQLQFSWCILRIRLVYGGASFTMGRRQGMKLGLWWFLCPYGLFYMLDWSATWQNVPWDWRKL